MLEDIYFNIKQKENDFEITINVPEKLGWIERMKFITETSNERNAYQMHHVENKNGFVCFKTNIYLETKALYHYYFSFEANHEFIYYKRENQKNTNSISKDEMWKMSVDFSVPDWAKGKIMYHIFVDRFYRGNENDLKPLPNRVIRKWNEDIMIGPNENGLWNTDFYGGDLIGIKKKLPYLKSLGVSILYLSPIVLSQSNHRYDTADYEIVDDYAGVNDDLKDLCDSAHQMGMKVILDAVFNHTGNDSKYFNEYHHFNNVGAFESMDSPYFPFYRKYITDDKVYFDYWWGMKNLPVCDGNSEKWQDYIYGVGGVIDKWFSYGIDGLRLDVADELTDSFIEGIRKAVKRNKPDGFILGEVWKNPMRMNRGYIESGKGMDSVMNYSLVNALIRYFKYGDCYTLKCVIHEILMEYPNDTIYSLMNFTSTHDITRAINIFGTNEFQINGEWSWNLNSDNRDYQKNYQMSMEQYEFGKKVYQAYLYTLTFFPGILSIFYGDEIGMQGLGNLANRRPFTWDKIDNEILNLFKKLGEIRNKETFLYDAKIKIHDINENYFSFLRYNNEKEILFYVNRTSYKQKIILPEEFKDEQVIYESNNSNKQCLNPYGSIVLKKIKK